MLLNVGALIVVLGVLIFVHEAGHFIAAKAVGIQVLRFSLGFGPPIVRAKHGETEYWISWIPLGGYVKMAGLEDEGIAGELEGGKAATPVDPARAFDKKPVWARMVVLVAGVTMNMILALVLYTAIGVVLGAPESTTTRIDTVESQLLPAGATALADLRFGDQIARVNGDTVRTWSDILERIVRDSGRAGWRFDVAGRAEPVVVRLEDDSRRARERLALALVPLQPPRFGVIFPGQPAKRAGLRTGDQVLRANGDTVASWYALLKVIWRSPGDTIHLDLLRGDRVVDVTVVPDSQIESDTTGGGLRPRLHGAIGASLDEPRTYVRVSLAQAVPAAFAQTAAAATAIVQFLRRLVVGQESVREVGGPILIGQLSGQMARLGLPEFLAFMAFFSVQLAVLNILPIPVLDGGNLVFLVVEAVRRKPIDLQVRMRLLNIGFWVLIAIMLFAVGNDVLRIIPR